jgi:peptide/nickel transport system substrate-binding protein
MQRRGVAILCILGILLLEACAPAQRSPEARSDGELGGRDQPRTLIMASSTEVNGLAPKVIGPTNPGRTTRLFNAALALRDGRGEARPYLAEALPQLNSESWRVLPDGGMETTWRLRPNLTWHDGAPLSAEDFVFAWRVYTAPGLAGVFFPSPQDLIQDLRAPDARTLVIHWRTLYADAGAIIEEELDPLPRHLLEVDFIAAQDDADVRESFMTRRYWSTEHVGAGPFRFTAWEPGSHLQGEAFAGHALGRPKIDRLIVRFISDENTAATNILAEHITYTMQLTLRFEQGAFLHREWSANGRGVVIFTGSSSSTITFQLRPEFLQFPALADVRVRRAFVHGTDRQAQLDGIFDGQGSISHTYISREESFYPEIERAVVKYPYDPRRAEQLMQEAGYRKDRDGIFASESGGRLQPTLWVTSGSQTERLLAIMASAGPAAGFEFQPRVIPTAQARNDETRATFPGLLNYGITRGLSRVWETFSSGQIGSAANRWSGQNRGGWASAEYDRLVEAMNSTLERGERMRRMAAVARLLSEELPNFPLFPNLGAVTHLSTLKGPEAGTPDTTWYWDIQDWELS